MDQQRLICEEHVILIDQMIVSWIVLVYGVVMHLFRRTGMIQMAMALVIDYPGMMSVYLIQIVK